jgi:hypothetical protein
MAMPNTVVMRAIHHRSLREQAKRTDPAPAIEPLQRTKRAA